MQLGSFCICSVSFICDLGDKLQKSTEKMNSVTQIIQFNSYGAEVP